MDSFSVIHLISLKRNLPTFLPKQSYVLLGKRILSDNKIYKQKTEFSNVFKCSLSLSKNIWRLRTCSIGLWNANGPIYLFLQLFQLAGYTHKLQIQLAQCLCGSVGLYEFVLYVWGSVNC